MLAKKYYILKLDSYQGDGSSMACFSEGGEYMFVVLLVQGPSAEIVDWGYSSVDELLDSWSSTEFENIKEFQ